MDFLSSFHEELRQNGYEPIGPLRIDAGKWGRLMYDGEKAYRASGGYKLIQNPDGSLFANYGSSKDKGGFRSWCSNKERELNWQEISAAKSARLAHRKHMEEKELQRHQLIGARLAKAIARMPMAAEHPYLNDKKVKAHGIRSRANRNELIIPRYGADGRIYSIQRIIQKKTGTKSWKGYFKGALGKDLYYPLMEETDEKTVIVLVEGYATGASIREATGLCVVVCFDSGSLPGVARIMRQRYPAARILIGSDNDQWVFASGKKPKELDTGSIAGDDPRWSKWRQEGLLFNPGVDKAQAAAIAIGGAQVLVPDFPATHKDKFSDFNDLARERGNEHVKLMFQHALEIPRARLGEQAPGDGFEGSSLLDVQTVAGGEISVPRTQGDMGMAFKVLGYNNGTYFYYPFSMRQIVALSASSHSIHNLLQLDSLEHWEAKWRDHDGKLLAKHQTIALYAAASLTQLAERRGVFLEEARVRGAGCWIDDGRVVLHCGQELYVEGVFTRFEMLDSEFTYVAAAKLMRPARTALSSIEARQLRTICEKLTWENQLSGTLLAGWLVIAPICAALQYRPHIYVTGEAESGKSTVMDKIIKPVLGKMGLYVDGGTTEPSVRELMGYDARPLVYDEAEPSPSMPEVIALARKASTGAVVGKAGQRPFKARFSACFSAINPPVSKMADETRISFMHLKKNRRATAMQEYDELLTMIEEVITPEFSARLLARTLENMQSLLSNIRVFQRAARKTMGGARAAQQIGTMLAGVYMLGSDRVITEEAAIEIVSRFSWSDHTSIDQEGDPIRLVQWIAGSLVRSRAGTEESIGDLVTKAHLEKTLSEGIAADKVLRNYGITVSHKPGHVSIASRSQNLARLLRDTEWKEKWSRTLSDVEGAVKEKIVYFAPGNKTSAVSVPLKLFIENEHGLGSPVPDDQADWWPEGRE